MYACSVVTARTHHHHLAHVCMHVPTQAYATDNMHRHEHRLCKAPSAQVMQSASAMHMQVCMSLSVICLSDLHMVCYALVCTHKGSLAQPTIYVLYTYPNGTAHGSRCLHACLLGTKLVWCHHVRGIRGAF